MSSRAPKRGVPSCASIARIVAYADVMTMKTQRKSSVRRVDCGGALVEFLDNYVVCTRIAIGDASRDPDPVILATVSAVNPDWVEDIDADVFYQESHAVLAAFCSAMDSAHAFNVTVENRQVGFCYNILAWSDCRSVDMKSDGYFTSVFTMDIEGRRHDVDYMFASATHVTPDWLAVKLASVTSYYDKLIKAKASLLRR